MTTRNSLRQLTGAERTLPRLLERQAIRYGDKPLLRTETVTHSFAEMRQRAAAVAGRLAEGGIGRGDVVALMMENRAEVLELWLGCAWLGAAFAPLNTALRGQALEHCLKLSEARLLIIEPAFRDRLPHLSAVAAPDRLWVLADHLDGDAGDDLYPGPGEPVAMAPVRPGDVAALLLTSGTTGPSKMVACPQAQWFWWGTIVGEVLELGEDDILYTNLPLFHSNALGAFCQALVNGATLFVGPRFSGSRFWQRATEANATVSYLLGSMAHVLIKNDPGAHDRAHRIRVALAPGTSAEVASKFRSRFGVELVDAWGSTEANATISTAGTDAPAGTLGRLLSGFQARVVDDDDRDVPDGHPGELVLRSDLPFAFSNGYHGMPDATLALWRNLWLHTGDRVIRSDGVYTFVDRLKDVVRRRGENISAWEVEQTLLSHPDVVTAAVVGVPAELGDEEVMAFVIPKTGCEFSPEGLVEHCRPQLPDFSLPRYIEVVDELPLTASGRVEKHRLRRQGVKASTWDREAASDDDE